MTQSQFMYKLLIALSDLPDEEKYVVVNDYKQYFEQQINEGRSESDISSSLPPPEKIAQSYIDGNPLPIEGVRTVYDDESGRKSALSVFKFICLMPVAVVWEPVAAVLGVALLIVTAALCVAGVMLAVFSFQAVSLGAQFVLLALCGICAAIAFLLFSVAVFKAFIKLIKLLPSFMGKVLKNKKKAGHYA